MTGSIAGSGPTLGLRYDGLVTGAALFTGDLSAPGMLHLGYVRSPLAHAKIRSIDVTAAVAAPGVVAVYTAGDLLKLPLWEIALIPQALAQPALADGVVRYVGERVVAVLAESAVCAADGAERVIVDYEPLPVLADTTAATAEGAPDLFAGHAGNVCLAWPSDAPGARPQGTSVTVSVQHVIPRVCAAPMEGHAVLAVPGPDGRLTMWLSTQVPTAARSQIARTLMIDVKDVRVVVPTVGGGFGGKAAGAMGDHMIAAAAARRLGRPVRFVEDRNANLIGMQGRGVRNRVELHATADGRVRGMKADIVCDAGAYPNVGAVEPGKTRMMVCGPYRISAVDVSAAAVMTNRSPVGAYRGPGRSEASVMLERTLDILAAELTIDPVEIRRRNLLGPDELPHRTPTGIEYDSGNFPALLDRLVAVAGYDHLRQQQQHRRAAGGLLLGVGVSVVVDSTAWFARTEGASVGIDGDGTVVVRTGSASAGQQHPMLLRAVVRSRLPVPLAAIAVIEGDTDQWDVSDGSMGSRTAQLAGTAVLRSTEEVVERLRRLAADALEADPADIVFHDGAGFGVRGVPSTAMSLQALTAGLADRLEANCVYEQSAASYPSAAHLSVVEVDADTGRVRPVRHVAVTDCGYVLDPPSAQAQVVGATVQGIGQALYEEAVFDDAGNPLCASFGDYGIPSAAEVPSIEACFLETRSSRNPLGAKGVGEIGMIAAPVAVQNAVVDAIRHLGVRHLDMPCTPARVWAAIHGRN